MIRGGVSVSVSVVVGDGHVIQPVVLRRQRARVRQAVGLVRESIGWAEALCRAYGAGPLAGVNVRMHVAIPLEAIFFGPGCKHRQTDEFRVVVKTAVTKTVLTK